MTVGAGKPKQITRDLGDDGNVTYVAIYDVLVTDPFESPDAISTATDIPDYGDSLTWGTFTNPDAICSKKSVAHVDGDASNLRRTVTCTFTTKTGGRSRSSNNVVTNPIDEPWKKGGSFATGTRVTSIDKDGLPITTTGLETKFLEVVDGYDTLHLEGPSQTMSLTQRAQSRVRCNSAEIWGLTARMVLLAQWQWNELFHGDTSYFYHRMEFWIKYEGWNELWLNQGTQEYVSGNAVGKRIVPIIATNDTLGKQIKFLDQFGRIIPETGIPGSVVTNTSKIVPEFDFTVLTASIGMPNPLPGNFV